MSYKNRLYRILLSTTVGITILCSSTFAADWKKPWASEKSQAAVRCAETFEQFQLQAVCMDNERAGFDKMQGNFGLPADVAAKAKERCARIFAQFQLQAVCMGNEKEGYEKMMNY